MTVAGSGGDVAAPPAGAARWRELPGSGRDGREGAGADGATNVLIQVVGVAVVGLPAAARVLAETPQDGGRALRAVAVLLAGWVVAELAGALGRRPTAARVLAAAIVVLVVAAVGSRVTAVSVVLGVVSLWAATPGRRAGDGRDPTPAERLDLIGPLLGFAVVSSLTAAQLERPSTMLVVQAIGVVVVSLPGRPLARAGRLLTRAVRFLVRAASVLVTTVVALLVVFLPWLVERAIGWDPLWAPRRFGSRFVPRHVQRTDGRRTWLPRTSLLPGWQRRMRTALPRALALSIVAFVTVQLALEYGSSIARDRDLVAQAPEWWARSRFAEQAAFEGSTFSAFLGTEMPDISSAHVNVADGRRATWHPPAQPQARVWFFGGSTAFGFGQRDEHTIPSEVARQAWSRGIALEVTNFGVPGDVNWMEHQRLRDALASAEEPPDLVVFYDGWNDLSTQQDGASDSPPATYRGPADAVVGQLDRTGPPIWLRPFLRGYELTDRPAPPPRDGDDVVDAALRQYATSVAAVRRDLDGLGLPVRFFVQPLASTWRSDGASTTEGGELYSRFVAGRPSGVTDLTAAMDAGPRSVYLDDGHHGEAGAELVARAMLEDLLHALGQQP